LNKVKADIRGVTKHRLGLGKLLRASSSSKLLYYLVGKWSPNPTEFLGAPSALVMTLAEILPGPAPKVF